MSIKVDLHNHTYLCNHANGTMQEYIQKAIKHKIDIFGFSEHAPMKFDKKYRMRFEDLDYYKKEIYKLQQLNKGLIDIKYGFEVDYLPKYHEELILKDKDVDYLIGSVHFLDTWGFDNPEFIAEYKNRDIDKIWEEYFEAIKNMAKSRLFNIVGHIDLIKVFKFMPKKDIRLIVKDAIKEIKKSGMAVEINFAGYRKPIQEQYPSRNILELCYESNIPITFGSDAHQVDQIDQNQHMAYMLAKEIGYEKVASFSKKEIELFKI